METALAELLSFSNLMMALAIFALVFVQRKVAESIAKYAFKKDISKSGLWRDLFLPLGPLGTGALVMMIPGLPVPALFAVGLGGKIIYGVGLGLMSGLTYRMAKKLILDKMGKEDEETPYTK